MIKILQQTISFYLPMENSVLVRSMRTLTTITASLQQLSLSSKFVIPDIVVAGSKCGGKSSTIEKLIGFEYLPREYNTDTQRIQFRFIYTPNLALPEAQIVEQISKGSIIRYADFDKLRDNINKLTVPHWNNNLPNNPIIVNIYTSFMPNLTVIDLPGYSGIITNASYQAKLNQTRIMIQSQIARPGSIILGVFGANCDYIGCDVLRIMRQRDPKGFRSLAAIPKIDIMDRGTDALSILNNEEIPLRNGYIGIKNRSSLDRKSASIEQALAEEESFFKSSKFYKDLPRQLWGTESLSLKLVEIIYQQTMKQILVIAQQLKHKKTAIKTKIQHQLNIGIFFESAQVSEKRMGELKAELEPFQSLQKLIDEDPFFTKVLNNHKQNPQNYNEIPEHLKPIEMIRPRKNDFEDFFRPKAPFHFPPPPKPKNYANSEQREADERKKKTFNQLFGI